MAGVSVDHSFPRPCPSQKTLRRCRYSEERDHMILIGVDSENFETIIIIDVPDSLPKEKPRHRTNEWSFRNVINIDDDEAPENNHSVGLNNMNASPDTSSRGKFCKRDKNSTDCADAAVEKNQSVKDNVTPVRLSKCKCTYSGNASTGNRYGLDAESERDISDYDYCELVGDSSGEVEELWRKTDTNSGKFGFRGVSSSSFIDKDDCDNTGEEFTCRQTKEPYQVRRSYHNASDFKRPYKRRNKKEAEHPTSSNVSFHGQPGNCGQPAPVFSDGKFSTKEREKVENSTRTDINSGHFGFRGGSGSSSSYKQDYETAGEENRFWRNKWPYQVRSSDGEAGASKSQNKKEAEHPTSSNIYFDGQPTEFDLRTPIYSDGKVSADEPKDVEYCRRQIETEIASATSSGGTDSQNIEEATCSSVREPKHSESRQLHPTAIPEVMRENINLYEENSQEDESLLNSQQRGNKDGQQEMQNVDAVVSNVTCMIVDREKIKETVEYKRAMDDEWVSRLKARRIQFEEAQNRHKLLLKRKRTESLRLLNMERRQKERLEEFRTSQKKEEENMRLKEVTRAEVRKQLNDLEIKCKSISSLLYSLGITVAVWPNPSPQEVQTLYKRALVAFHPDRASRSDIRQQVEAEEKFKLINGLREKFKLINGVNGLREKFPSKH